MPVKQERWKQRFENFNRAYFRLAEAIDWGADGSDTDLFASNKAHDIIQEALVKRFELVFELAWNVLRDYLQHLGFTQDEVRGPKQVIRRSYQEGLIRSADVWMAALASRNKAVHIYREEVLLEVCCFARVKFFPVVRDMHSYFAQEYEQ